MGSERYIRKVVPGMITEGEFAPPLGSNNSTPCPNFTVANLLFSFFPQVLEECTRSVIVASTCHFFPFYLAFRRHFDFDKTLTPPPQQKSALLYSDTKSAPTPHIHPSFKRLSS